MPEPAGAVIFAAHPDDETIGVGAQLPTLPGVHIVHVTDGAPRDLKDAAANGFRTREEYAAARHEELMAALALAGIKEDRTCAIGVVDQEASYDLAWLAYRIADLMDVYAPAIVLAPAYEGGHPDHDATAFAVHAACRFVERPPRIEEYALYHCRDGAMIVSEFPAGNGCEVTTIELSAGQRDLKRRMIECFRTQRETLAPFGVTVERRRVAPAYDFGEPPPASCIYYDMFPWGIRSDAWREKARAALEAVGLRGAI